jgi:5-formyltetrahydrofolate cyclo-ligase
MKKELIRKHTKNALRFLTLENRKRESEAITQTILDMYEYKTATSVFVFLSLPEEFDTAAIIANALKDGKKVYVPYCIPNTKEIRVTQITDVNTDIIQGHYNIPEPRPELRDAALNESPIKIDCLIVPGLAFDHECTRLGRGAGYFDRFLPAYKNKSPILCPALSAQLYHYTIPKEAHDVIPDAVITEKDILRPVNFMAIL